MWVINVEGVSSSFSPPLLIGRSAAAVTQGDAFCCVAHKYLSRAHVRLSVAQGSSEFGALLIEQLGKNPTFFGEVPTALPSGEKVFLPPSLGTSYLSFPRELGLPRISISYCGAAERLGGLVDSRSDPFPTPALSITVADAFMDDEEYVDVQPEGMLDALIREKQASSIRIERRESAEVVPLISVSRGTPFSVSSEKLTIPVDAFGQSVAHCEPPLCAASAFVVAATNHVNVTAGTEELIPHQLESKLPPSSATPEAQPLQMGFWEWKARLDGDDEVLTNWKPYSKQIAEKLESAFRTQVSTVSIDAVYGVCFDDKKYGMVQYRLDDSTRWRPVRRRGGGAVARPNAKRVRVIGSHTSSDSDSDEGICAAAKRHVRKRKQAPLAGSSSDDEDDESLCDSWLVDDDESDTSSDCDESSLASLASSSSDSEPKRKKKVHRRK